MSRIIGLVVSLALVGALAAVEPVAVAAPVAATSAWTMPAEDRAAINQLLELAIAHGFPDASGAVLYKGELTVVQPTSDRQTFRSGRRHRAEGSSDYDGIHLRFPDGTWLAGMAEMVQPATGVVVHSDKAVAFPAADLFATVTKNNNQTKISDEPMQDFLALYPLDQRDQVRSAFHWMPVLVFMPSLQDPTTAMPTVMHLVRLGVPDSERLALLMNLMFKELLGGESQRPQPLLLTDDDRELWSARDGGPSDSMTRPRTVPALVPTTRQVLANWFKQQALGAPNAVTARLSNDQAIAGMVALGGGDLSPSEREELRLLRDMAVLPTVLPAGATMALRVALADPQPQGNRIRSESDTSNRFSLDDIEALIALVGNDGPTRWMNLDRYGNGPNKPRTLGDNALRILADLLGIDPRRLVGLDPLAEWSPAARIETALALQRWWDARGEVGLDGLLARAVISLDPGSAAALVTEVNKPELQTALVEHWRASPPLSASTAVLASALTHLKDGESLSELVRTWPVSGEHQLVLATWHAVHGEQRHLDDCFAAALAAPAPSLDADERSTSKLALVLAIADEVPSLARCNAALTTLAGPLDGAAARDFLQLTLSYLFVDHPTKYLAERARAPAGDTMRRLLQVALLSDTRPPPAGLFRIEHGHLFLVRGHQSQTVATGSADKPLILPTDVRLCDIAALCASKNGWRWGLQNENHPFDLTLPLAERDAAIAAIRENVTESAKELLQEASLPLTLLPAAAATPADPKALF